MRVEQMPEQEIRGESPAGKNHYRKCPACFRADTGHSFTIIFIMATSPLKSRMFSVYAP
ncbi:MAG: hypothetical protein JWQ98_1578 [Chlorobi bacterium]|nr:hypothetical protein [Chlorobiota bacterium]